MSGRPLSSVQVLGIPLTVLGSYSDAVRLVLSRVEERRKTFCVAVNPEKILRARNDPELRDLIRQADLHICDGVGAAIGALLIHRRRVARITGVQLFLHLVRAAEEHGLGVFLVGASAESNAQAQRRLIEWHPRLRIVGGQDGFCRDDCALVDRINSSGADLLFVGMGSPRQERWIARHRARIQAPFCMGIGGTLDVVSGRVRWAPSIFRRTGTEFLYRLACEPTRWKRQIRLPLFMLLAVRAALAGSLGPRRRD